MINPKTTQTMTHTKGKWTVRRKPVVNTVYTWHTSIQIFPWNIVPITGTKTIICRVFGGTKINCEANAQLIAAAPEMLKTLKNVFDFILYAPNIDMRDNPIRDDMIYETLEAIKHATK